MSEIHCAGCDAVFQEGWQFCPKCGPKCGIRLVETAEPAEYVQESRFLALAVILGAIRVLLVVIYAVSK